MKKRPQEQRETFRNQLSERKRGESKTHNITYISSRKKQVETILRKKKVRHEKT